MSYWPIRPWACQAVSWRCLAIKSQNYPKCLRVEHLEAFLLAGKSPWHGRAQTCPKRGGRCIYWTLREVCKKYYINEALNCRLKNKIGIQAFANQGHHRERLHVRLYTDTVWLLLNSPGTCNTTLNLACSKRSGSGKRCRVKKAMKSRGGLGREVTSPPPSLLFFRAPFYFAPLPTIWTPGTGYIELVLVIIV